MAIRNLTPHDINFYMENDEVRVFPSVGLARAEQTNIPCGTIDGLPVVKPVYGEPYGLPEPEVGDVWLIVSALTAEAAKRSGRTTEDLLLTTDLVRDEGGRIIGCRKFAAFE